MTSAIPVQRSTNWANKPTGSWSMNWVQINRSVLSCKDLLISSLHRSANMWIFIYLKSSSIPFSFAISKDREVIMQSRPALYCCVRWLRTSEAELDNAHWTHGLTVAWPYMHFSFSVWEATTITIAMPRWCGPTGPKQLAVTWMGYFCFKGYSFFVKGAVLVTLRLLPKCAFCGFKIQFTVPFIQFLYFSFSSL